MIAFALADAGDGILLTRPVYGRYELDFGMKAGVKILYADTDAKTCFESGVITILETAIMNALTNGTKVRALLIVNPHNPLGMKRFNLVNYTNTED
jgi:1-aminocyclopropane-1-carboxylate synthase